MSITAHLDAWYTQKGQADDARRREEHGGYKIGPSNLGDCLRKTACLLSGMQPAPLSPEALRVFELGHQRGAALEAAAKDIWPDAQTQVPVRIPLGKFHMLGTADLWIPSLRTLVDFKTIGSYGAGLLDKEGVSLEYQLQVHAYRDALGNDLAGPLPEPSMSSEIRAVVVYEAKDSDARKGVKAGSLRELEVPWTLELESLYQERLMLIEGMLLRREAGRLDPGDYDELPLENGKESWKCKYCSIGKERGGCYK